MLDRVRSWLPGAHKRAAEPAPKRAIEGTELLEWISQKKPLTLLDVRDQKDYRQGHIKGATLIPGGELQQRMYELRTDRTVVVVAGTDAKGVKASRQLRNAGLDVLYLKGGITAWPGKLVR